MSGSRDRRKVGLTQRLSAVAPSERQDADLFLADLLGVHRPGSPIVGPVPRPTSASWARPDLSFDNYVHRSARAGKAALGEVADEGWTVVASPLSNTPPETLRPNDVVIQRAMGDGRLAFVHALNDVDARYLYHAGGLIRSDTLVLRN